MDVLPDEELDEAAWLDAKLLELPAEALPERVEDVWLADETDEEDKDAAVEERPGAVKPACICRSERKVVAEP